MKTVKIEISEQAYHEIKFWSEIRNISMSEALDFVLQELEDAKEALMNIPKEVRRYGN